MQRMEPSEKRSPLSLQLNADLVVVGGGLAGVCCAITAAREGQKVVLVQDRPVLGGNASSEVRLWALGATSHMGNNNRWAREGGVIDEILVENTFRNPDGNSLIFDTVLLEKVVQEPGITLLLNTAVYDLDKSGPDTISRVRAFCSQNSTAYELEAPLFCDASGDGIVGFLAGGAFRMGAESKDEFDEGFAPNESNSELLGHSIYFYTKDVGRPVSYTPPSYALSDITKIPRYRNFKANQQGCQLWWIEYGGLLDTVHDAEEIKWELWKIVYGVWNHIKNSGSFPEAENLTLEWVGTIPGKRESRRFEGDFMLSQKDLIEQRVHDDAVSCGGWAIDMHPSEGIYSELSPCTQWHSKGVYQIPYRTMYSRNIDNLFLAGRITSASHLAFGSTRVMLTCAHSAQAVGVASALCQERQGVPRDLLDTEAMDELQQRLLRRGQFIPGVVKKDSNDLVQSASITASSEFKLSTLAADGPMLDLSVPRAMLIPLGEGAVPSFSLDVAFSEATEIEVELRVASKAGNYTPDVILATRQIALTSRSQAVVHAGASTNLAGNQTKMAKASADTAVVPVTRSIQPIAKKLSRAKITVDFGVELDNAQYGFICIKPNAGVKMRCSERRVTGVLQLSNRMNGAVAKGATQEPPEGSGIDTFEFWLPQRRPGGHNLAMQIDPPLRSFQPNQVANGEARPTLRANAWVADPDDPKPTLHLKWKKPQTVRVIELSLDTDFDHAMESVLMGHPETVMPYCVQRLRIKDQDGKELARIDDNHQTRIRFELPESVSVTGLDIELEHPSPMVAAALFEVRCYA
jgi:hypothetical protein